MASCQANYRPPHLISQVIRQLVANIPDLVVAQRYTGLLAPNPRLMVAGSAL